MKTAPLLIILTCLLSYQSYAEGTAQLDPSPNDVTFLLVNDPTYGNFATYDSNEFERLYFTIEDPNEVVYIGLHDNRSSTDGNGSYNFYYRIKDAAGNIVKGPIFVNGNTDNVNSYSQAVAGPNFPGSGNTGGYTVNSDYTFNPASAGDYYIEFNRNQTTVSSSILYLKWWDITVVDSGAVQDGRVWAYNWGLRTPQDPNANGGFNDAWNRPFNGQFYVFSDNNQDGELEGLTNIIDFQDSGFRGLSFSVSFNSTGVADTGDLIEDRKSVENANSTYSEFPIFLNNPDETIWLDAPVGEIVADTEYLICVDEVSSEIRVTTTVPGQLQLILDFNETGVFEENSEDVILATTIEDTGNGPYEAVLTWDNKNGIGEEVFDNDEIPLIATLLQGVFHFPAYDLERNPNGFDVQSVRPGANFTGDLYYDDSNISVTGGSGTGAPITEINGCPAPCHGWTNFPDGSTAGYGNLNTINTWWIANTDTRSVVLTQICLQPVKWLSFTANHNDGITQLDWSTASETNASHFTVERRMGTEGDYEAVGEVAASGNSTVQRDYQFFDDVIGNGQDIYYRLKQVDFDGSFDYSEIVLVHTEEIEDKLFLYQTFVTGNIIDMNYHISEEEQGEALLYISNSVGRVLQIIDLGEVTPGSHSQSIQLSPNGMTQSIYFITLQTATGKYTRKFFY